MRRPTRLPTLPRGYACGRYRLPLRRRVAATCRSAIAGALSALAEGIETLATLIAGH